MRHGPKMLRTCLLLTMIVAGCPAKETEAPPPAAPASKPSEAPAPDEPPPVTTHGNPISGVVKLGEGIKAEDVKPTDVLFIMIRQSTGGGKFGRLIAVQRHAQIQFPRDFEVSSNDVMVPGIPFQGPFVVMARLDRDGDPMTRKPEDLYAVAEGEVANGAQGLQLILNKSTAQDVAPPEGAAPPPAHPPVAPSSKPAHP